MDPASTSFVLGYHGCNRRLAEEVFAGKKSLKPSENDYDWLGDGIYFWEHNARRAYQFACEVCDRPYNGRQKISEPAVVGAIVDLGLCLNLLDSRSIEMVGKAHADLEKLSKEAGIGLPANSAGPDLLVRKLDCAVVRFLHSMRAEAGDEPFDTVRAAFIEGGPLYDNAGFAAKNHIQLCVRNIACIKGYFRPLDEHGKPVSFRRFPERT